jgi:anti-sigma B factor antagonist
MELYAVMPPLLLPSGHVVVSVSGEVDIAAAEVMTAALGDAVRRARTGVIVDLGDLEFMDASGLGALVRTYQRSRHLPAGLRLASAPAHVLRILRVTGLSRYLTVFPSVTAAAEGTQALPRPVPNLAVSPAPAARA